MKILKLPNWFLFILDLIKLVIIAFLIVWPIHQYVFQPFLVQGPSMEPNFFSKEYLIIEKITYYLHQPQRGDVIVFKSPLNPKDYLIKRIIGLPNEKIILANGEIYIINKENPLGFKLKEEYLYKGSYTPGNTTIQLGPDEYFVLGDNRQISLDSRSFGPIKKEAIVGKVFIKGWPLNKLAKFKTPVYNYY
jgi:signal peptidase I